MLAYTLRSCSCAHVAVMYSAVCECLSAARRSMGLSGLGGMVLLLVIVVSAIFVSSELSAILGYC